MKIGLKASFQKGITDGKFYFQLFEKLVKFSPYSFRKNSVTKFWDEKKHTKAILSLKTTDSIGVASNKEDLFIITNTGTLNPHLSIGIIQEGDLFLSIINNIEWMFEQEGFIAAYLYNEDYEVVQSTSFSNNYSHKNYSNEILNSIAKTPYKINEFGNKEYEIKNNPGRMDLIGYCWLMAGWKMWFGDSFFKIVDKQKLLNFPFAYEIKESLNGNVYVNLFERVEDSAKEKNMEIQRKWREWLEFEKLISLYK